jgi:malate synthase
MSTVPSVSGVEVHASWQDGYEHVQTAGALELLAMLHRTFGPRLAEMLGIQYLESWLRGVGAVAIFNLMEEVGTAQISRSQVWQWVHNGLSTAAGTPMTADYVRALEAEGLEKVKAGVGDDVYAKGSFAAARELFEQVALADDFVEFLTLPAYERIG